MKNVFVYTTSYGIAPNWYLQLYYNFCGTDLYENTGLWYKNVSTDLHGKTCTGTKTVVQICMGRPAPVQKRRYRSAWEDLHRYKNDSTDLHGKTCTGTKTVVQICMGRPALVQMAVLTSHAAAFQKLWKPQTAP